MQVNRKQYGTEANDLPGEPLDIQNFSTGLTFLDGTRDRTPAATEISKTQIEVEVNMNNGGKWPVIYQVNY